MHSWEVGRWIRRQVSRARTSHTRSARGFRVGLRHETLEERVLLSPAELRIVSYNIANATSTESRGQAWARSCRRSALKRSTGSHARSMYWRSRRSRARPRPPQTSSGSSMGSTGPGRTLAAPSTGPPPAGVVSASCTTPRPSSSSRSRRWGPPAARDSPVRRSAIGSAPRAPSGPDDFYLYNGDYKAGSDSTSQSRRLMEAKAVRANADALGPGVQIIYAGDFNTYSSNEAGYQALLASGNGQASDPINRPGAWHNNAAFAGIDNQATAVTHRPGCSAGASLTASTSSSSPTHWPMARAWSTSPTLIIPSATTGRCR